MIPKSARCVFRGVLFDVYQWKQEQFNGTYKTFEALKRKDSVQIIATFGNKIVLLDEEHPYVGKFKSVPGGMIDSGETPAEAVRRELLEETGFVPEEIESWMTTHFSSKIDWNTHYYFARNCRKKCAQHMDAGERIKIRLVSFEKFIAVASGEDFRNRELSNILFRLKQNKKELQAFKRKVFERKSKKT